MRYNLEKDLEKVDFFFNLPFASKLTFEINSNSYVRVLKEAIDKKGEKSFAGYDVYTDIGVVVDFETQNITYKLNVAFDKL